MVVGGEHGGLPDLALFAFAVAQHGENGVVLAVQAQARGHAGGDGQALAQASGADLNAGAQVAVRMALEAGTQLPEGHHQSEDELFLDACQFVVEQGGASTSSVQRKFRIGYNRAARLIEEMESQGIISEARGTKPRDVLISEDEFAAMQETNVQ